MDLFFFHLSSVGGGGRVLAGKTESFPMFGVAGNSTLGPNVDAHNLRGC